MGIICMIQNTSCRGIHRKNVKFAHRTRYRVTQDRLSRYPFREGDQSAVISAASISAATRALSLAPLASGSRSTNSMMAMGALSP